jgi:hypothetical protein
MLPAMRGQHWHAGCQRLTEAGLCSACRKALFASSGFKYSRFIRTRGIFSIVEAVPA